MTFGAATDADLVTEYAGCFVPTGHAELRRLERAAANGLCVLTWYASGFVRVHAAWQWPTRESQDEERIIWP